jgi:hypothetical protein
MCDSDDMRECMTLQRCADELSPGMERQFEGFSFANVDGLVGANMEKLQKIRDQVRISMPRQLMTGPQR